MPDLDDIDEEYEALSVGSMAVPEDASDRAIEKHFETGRLRVVQERNDIFLSHVIDFIDGNGRGEVWGNLRPEYQRRLRWDNKKKSKLIESFIMNVPVPPIFLYEKSLGRFEVMDGQQRLSAIADFMNGKFKLSGLEIWKALNGRNYAQIPPLLRRGLERAKISAITLMSDRPTGAEDSLDLRAQVFERLNTGGERLNPQELRNSLYSGPFNELLIDLASETAFTAAWDIPNHKENTLEDNTIADPLKKNNLYKRMTDAEIILRFFAFSNLEEISGSVRGMLDKTMQKYRHCTDEERNGYRKDFIDSLTLCTDVFGDQVFRLPAKDGGGKSTLSRPLYDAEMVAMHTLRARAQDIREKSDEISDAVLALTKPDSKDYELMVGRGNTAATIKERIERVIEVVLERVGNEGD